MIILRLHYWNPPWKGNHPPGRSVAALPPFLDTAFVKRPAKRVSDSLRGADQGSPDNPHRAHLRWQKSKEFRPGFARCARFALPSYENGNRVPDRIRALYRAATAKFLLFRSVSDIAAAASDFAPRAYAAYRACPLMGSVFHS